MELKDIVLSALAEIDNETIDDNINKNNTDNEIIDDNPAQEHLKTSEEIFLKNLRERILVLFEGFKAPNNKNIEAKVDLTLNFLEYLLATIDARLKENANK